MATLPTNGPTLTEVLAYLGDTGSSWDDGVIGLALDAEAIDQANRCRFPTVLVDDVVTPVYDAALTEALCRRVAHNLAVRALPLGVQATVTDGAALNTYVGGTDAEVKRLEAPYRRRTVG